MIILVLYCLFSSFTAERITFDSDADWIPSIAVDESCYVHIANTYGSQIRYITNRSGSWVIDSIMIDGSSPSIDVTPAGTPHIAFEADCGGDDDIYYATRIGAVWDIDTVVNNTVISSDPSLALSPDSVPHITYYDFDGGLSIRHADKGGGTWSTEVITGSSVGTYSSISIDGSGFLHVSFVAGTYGGNREISYSNDTSGSWATTAITSDALDDDFPTIAVDKNGNVHIVYAKDDGADWELWYATNETSVFVTEQLTDNVGIHDYGYPSVAVDNNCDVHIAYQENNVAGNIFYLSNMSGSWQQDTIFIAPWNKTLAWVDRSIAIDNLGFIHACLANQEGGAFTQETYHAISDAPVGIESPSFHASSDNCSIILHWTVHREDESIQYIIHRSLGFDSEYDEVARLFGSCSSPEGQAYSYKDKDVMPGLLHYYKLGVMKTNGSTVWYGPVSASLTGVKGYVKVFPNPFSTSTTITLPRISDHQNTRSSELKIYDLTGRKVRKISLLPFSFLLGAKATWDGKDDKGRLLPAGMYFLEIDQNGFKYQEKVQIIR